MTEMEERDTWGDMDGSDPESLIGLLGMLGRAGRTIDPLPPCTLLLPPSEHGLSLAIGLQIIMEHCLFHKPLMLEHLLY